jgi:hypothetical protein
MGSLEHWVLLITDSDACWFGLGWLRPGKRDRISFLRLVLSSILLGMPGVLVGGGLIYAVLGHVDSEVCLGLLAVVMLFELLLHAIWAYFWNRRAAALARAIQS